MKIPRNIVFFEVDSIQQMKSIPVLRIKAHLPEIVLDGYRLKKNTKNLYLTIDVSNVNEFKVFSDYLMLEDHIDHVFIVKDRLKDYSIGKILSSTYPSVAKSIIAGLVVKTYIDYIINVYSDYDGYNLNIDPTNPGFISISGEEEKAKYKDLIEQYSEEVLKLLEEQV